MQIIRVDGEAGGDAEGAGPGPAMLADCCEAIIGAIYLDGGFAPAQTFVLRHWARLLADGKAPQRDAKSALKEWADAHGPTVPAYRVIERSGPDHAMIFTVEVRLDDRPPQIEIYRSDGTIFGPDKLAELRERIRE